MRRLASSSGRPYDCVKVFRCGVEALVADLAVDLRSQRTPSVDRAVEPELLDGLDGPVYGHPRHHLGVGEVAAGATDLPDALVGLAPLSFEELHDRALEAPDIGVMLDAGDAAPGGSSP